jgi:hypothetical protein
MESRSIFRPPRGDQSTLRTSEVVWTVRRVQALAADDGGGRFQKRRGGEAGPVPKLTQVGEAKSLRRSRERS